MIPIREIPRLYAFKRSNARLEYRCAVRPGNRRQLVHQALNQCLRNEQPRAHRPIIRDVAIPLQGSVNVVPVLSPLLQAAGECREFLCIGDLTQKHSRSWFAAKVNRGNIAKPVLSIGIRVWAGLYLNTAFGVYENGPVGPQIIRYNALIIIHAAPSSACCQRERLVAVEESDNDAIGLGAIHDLRNPTPAFSPCLLLPSSEILKIVGKCGPASTW